MRGMELQSATSDMEQELNGLRQVQAEHDNLALANTTLRRQRLACGYRSLLFELVVTDRTLN
jgi:hypothetical protein